MSEVPLSDRPQDTLQPEDAESWLRHHGWERRGVLPNVASLWQQDDYEVMLPSTTHAPDFSMRWNELLQTLSEATERHPSSIALEMSSEWSDVAEWRASGSRSIDHTIPLSDGEVLVRSARQAVVAAANATLQRRAYFGHSVPKVAREHSRTVRMGQTREGSYIVPIISRIPNLAAMAGEIDEHEGVLFELGEEPFQRRVMRRLAVSVNAVKENINYFGPDGLPSGQLHEVVSLGVSHELCASLGAILSSDSVEELHFSFSWARRVSARDLPTVVDFPKAAAEPVKGLAEQLRGSDDIAEQTINGFVVHLDRDEELFGTIKIRSVLRTATGQQERRISMDLSPEQYERASEANRRRRPVSVTGTLHRPSGRAWKFENVRRFDIADSPLDAEW